MVYATYRIVVVGMKVYWILVSFALALSVALFLGPPQIRGAFIDILGHLTSRALFSSSTNATTSA